MIITKLMGGLGNQIFQWAHGKSLSIIYDREFFLDDSFYSNQINVTPRKFELHFFPRIKFSKLDEKINTSKFIKIGDSSYPSIKNLDRNENYLLEGYFQSEVYFDKISEVIKEELSMTNEKEEYFKRKYDFENSVSIHIRRSDYLTSNGFHPVLPISYYSKALSLFKYKKIYVFSDDIEWCKNNLKFDNIYFVENSNNYEDIWLMSLCENNIIANSSFSWWGAWLNKSVNKKVIAPKLWFNGMNNHHMIPNKWTII